MPHGQSPVAGKARRTGSQGAPPRHPRRRGNPVRLLRSAVAGGYLPDRQLREMVRARAGEAARPADHARGGRARPRCQRSHRWPLSGSSASGRAGTAADLSFRTRPSARRRDPARTGAAVAAVASRTAGVAGARPAGGQMRGAGAQPAQGDPQELRAGAGLRPRGAEQDGLR
ncbi:hypothetical protein D9M71_482450 [compost metagenome]